MPARSPSRYVAAVVDEAGRLVPLPPACTEAVGRARSRQVAVSQARIRFTNATGLDRSGMERLGFRVAAQLTR